MSAVTHPDDDVPEYAVRLVRVSLVGAGDELDIVSSDAALPLTTPQWEVDFDRVPQPRKDGTVLVTGFAIIDSETEPVAAWGHFVRPM